jgi:hypothetical protein
MELPISFVTRCSWLQVLEFEDNVLPPNFLVGNGGTKMIKNNIYQSSIPHLDFQIHQNEFTITGKVKKGLTLSQFGYSIMERSKSGTYKVTFHVWDKQKSKVTPLDYVVSIHSRKATEDLMHKGRAQEFRRYYDIFLLLVLLAVCLVTIWKWSQIQRKRFGYSPIYEMEPVVHR